jgi:ferredoxin
MTAVTEPKRAAEEPFEVHLNGSGATVQVGSEETLLEALRRNGVHVDSSCEAGQCGTCILEYTEGEVLHRDTILDDDERTEVLTPCVSRARGRMAIDL